MGKKVIFCTPSIGGPTAPYIKSLEDSLPLIEAAGWEESYVQEISNPYISGARAIMARKAIDAKADIIMLDNMDLETMRKGVQLIGGRAKVEASGNITLERLRDVAATGVDYISIGALTHSVSAMDISQRIED